MITVDDLKAREKKPSTWFRPQLERGKFDPFGDESKEWSDAGREEPFWHPKRPEMLPDEGDTRPTADGEYK